MASRSKKKPRKRKPTGHPAKSEIESAILTFIAGLIPSGIAARKDPVEALRTE